MIKKYVRCLFNLHKPGDKPNTLILTTPRSGSTWLMEILLNNENFRKDKHQKDGYHWACKKCLSLKEVKRKIQKLSVYDAIKMYTINSAYSCFEKDRKGILKEGYEADIVVLDQDPFIIDPKSIDDIEVYTTIVNGNIDL